MLVYPPPREACDAPAALIRSAAAVDWNFAIERNRGALKRVLAALVAVAGLATLSTSPVRGGRRGASGGDSASEARPTLPRHLHRAVLRLLRPAESATRRLVIMAARGLAVTLPPPRRRPAKPEPPPVGPLVRPGIGTGIVMPPHLRPAASGDKPPARTLALPLFDPLRQPARRRWRAASGVPRIGLPGLGQPFPVPARSAPAPDDRIDAARLALRLTALRTALDDLPREAKRFARWRTRRDAEGTPEAQAPEPKRRRRLRPLRLGSPPGLPRRPAHEVHDILSDTHAMAFAALERTDTS